MLIWTKKRKVIDNRLLKRSRRIGIKGGKSSKRKKTTKWNHDKKKKEKETFSFPNECINVPSSLSRVTG